jgi:hypothetical protein
MEAKTFRGGIPVAPDVKMLMDHFGTPEPGTTIGHDQVEQVLGLRCEQHRYRTVVARWMRELWDDRNVRIVGIRGGFLVCTSEERLKQGERQCTKGARRISQSIKEVATTPVSDLTPEQVYRRDHLMKMSVMAYAAVKDAQRQYGLSLKNAPQALPKPK